MIQVLLILHVLVGAALLGAITHQSFSVARKPVAPPRVVRRSIPRRQLADVHERRSCCCSSSRACSAGCCIRAIASTCGRRSRTCSCGGQRRLRNEGAFAAVGLGLLPAYWLAWRPPLALGRGDTRKYLTWILAFIVWWNFLVGELLNNIKGLFP